MIDKRHCYKDDIINKVSRLVYIYNVRDSHQNNWDFFQHYPPIDIAFVAIEWQSFYFPLALDSCAVSF